ncbi:MAG: hypothetical protein RMY36_016870 [Nostoc sp. SerVER01]|nr:hypothetical protein [Nostoc sp. SerVER01]MDZ8027872.1 hypothetical protein [Nostoc sp. DedQUE11]MDZ8081897.1 hypothetical protein [Nostoc sp. DcaGUA01]
MTIPLSSLGKARLTQTRLRKTHLILTFSVPTRRRGISNLVMTADLL